MKLQVPAEVINFLAERIRALQHPPPGGRPDPRGVLRLADRPALNVEVLEYLLRDTLDQEKQEELTTEEIQKVVADYFDIRMADMTSNRRPQNIAFPRQVAMYLCREMTASRCPPSGPPSARNHATVLHALPAGAGPAQGRSGVPADRHGPPAAPGQAGLTPCHTLCTVSMITGLLPVHPWCTVPAVHRGPGLAGSCPAFLHRPEAHFRLYGRA
jgi:hypothetical protein